MRANDNTENPEIDELELENKVKSSSDHSYTLKSPQSLTHLSATARSIMDELRERHKLIDARGGKNIYPGELLTLDKITEALQKFPNLSIQAKSTEAINIALQQLYDVEGKGANKIIYLYPFLINNNNKVVAKVAIVAPQTSHEVDIKKYKDACFEHSKSMIDLILKNRARKVKEVSEDEPGQFLQYKNKYGEKWLYPHLCSLESEITMLLKKAFKPYNYISVRDFIDDFIIYGKEKSLLKQILDNYHIIVDEIELNEDGSYKRQPEIVIHYRAQADGLEKFAYKYLRELIDKEGDSNNYRIKLSDFKRDFIDACPANRRQNREKIKELISLAQNFNFRSYKSDFSSRIEKTIEQSVRILEKLIVEMDGLINRKFDTIQDNLKKNIINYVSEFTKRELVLCPVDVKKEVFRAGIKDIRDIEAIQEEIKKILQSEFGTYSTTDEAGNKIIYAVDQGYMASVLHKLTSLARENEEFSQQLEYARAIYDELFAKKDPKLNGKIKEDHLAKLTEDIHKIEHEVYEKRKREEFQKKYNLPIGVVFGVFFLLVCFILATYSGDFLFILGGIPLSFVVGYIAARFFRIKAFQFKSTGRAKNKDKPISADKTVFAGQTEEEREAKSLEIARIAEQFVFPKNYKTVDEKILDHKQLKSKINEHLAEIQSKVSVLQKEEDMNKVASSIEYSLVANSVVIAIPTDLVPKRLPNSVIISKSDFKSPLFRTQLAEHYRTVLDKHKLDKSLVKYYTFLINTLEMEYYKFLNRIKK